MHSQDDDSPTHECPPNVLITKVKISAIFKVTAETLWVDSELNHHIHLLCLTATKQSSPLIFWLAISFATKIIPILVLSS